jgi:hypothetical protein
MAPKKNSKASVMKASIQMNLAKKRKAVICTHNGHKPRIPSPEVVVVWKKQKFSFPSPFRTWVTRSREILLAASMVLIESVVSWIFLLQ